MKMMRVEFEAPIGWAPSHNFIVDMILGPDNRPRAGVPFCGWWGRLASREAVMFVVLPNGTVDFGANAGLTNEERHGNINFHGRVIEPGQLATYSDRDEWIDGLILRVGRMTDLLDFSAQT